MVRCAAWVLVLMCVAGCESKSAKPEAPKTPVLPAGETKQSAADKELQRFLNGMLITSEVPPPREALWPSTDDASVLYWLNGIAARRFGITRPEEVDAFLRRPLEARTRSDAWLHQMYWNAPAALQTWKQFTAADPLDGEAVLAVSYYTALLEGSKAGLALIADVDVSTLELRDRRGRFSPARFDEHRCFLALDSGQLERARAWCRNAQALDDEYGAVFLGRVLLALGKKKEGLAQLEQASRLPYAPSDASTWLWLGLAQQLNGKLPEAEVTWRQAASRWPENKALAAALAGDRKSPLEWHAFERGFELERWANDVAYCGAALAELGFTEASEACYAASETIHAGGSLPHRLVFLSRTDRKEARARLETARKTDPNPNLTTALAYVLYRDEKYAESRALLDEVLASTWNDPKATQQMWQVCGKQNDLLCVIEYRKRLGLPTHFNQEQYREVSRAWKEQAEKNGVHLAAKEAASSESVAPPSLRAVTIVPLANREPPELEDVVKALAPLFPGVTITVAPREESAPAVKPGDSYALWERVVDRLRDEPGALYVIEQDLLRVDDKFAFSLFDLEKGRGVASVSRLRSLPGWPQPAALTHTGDVLVAVKRRTVSLLANAVGKLLGLSFPCDDKSCPMREQRSVMDLSVPQRELCAKHKAELAARLAK